MFVYKNLKDAAAFGVLGSLGYTVPVSRSGAPPPRLRRGWRACAPWRVRALARRGAAAGYGDALVKVTLHLSASAADQPLGDVRILSAENPADLTDLRASSNAKFSVSAR